MLDHIKDFLKLESASGLVLLAAALTAVAFANSPFAESYHALIRPLTFTINDGLMAIFFLIVGIEIKREVKEGELSTRATAAMPVVAALGGIILPALIYSYFNWGTHAMRGWAIPSATDIAFSLGVLALMGSRVPQRLKIFLMAVAVIDDLAAVVIIAVFYTDHLSWQALAAAFICLAALMVMSRRMTVLWPYIIAGIALWIATVYSGVHPTVAGVALAFLMPLSLGKRLLHHLHPWVAFGVMPVFAFANAGVPLAGIDMPQLLSPVPLGIALGLFLGKQIGIFAASWLFALATRTALPVPASQFYAVCMIAGIGFTMSLFIGTLAFPGEAAQVHVRIGVIIGSLLSAVFGYILLALSTRSARGAA